MHQIGEPFSTAAPRVSEEPLPPVGMMDDDEAESVEAAEAVTGSSAVEDPVVGDDSGASPPTSPELQMLRRSSRAHNPPRWMDDYVGNLETSSSTVTGTSVTPLTFPYTISPSLSSSYVHFLLNVSTVHEPASYQEASNHIEWVEAMQTELDALEANHTWDLVTLPVGKKPIGNKWVYKVKLKPNGELERCKARLVAKGFNQEEGIDYTEVFSPVAKMVTVRVLFAIAASYNWSIHQVDVNNAFLHGFLHDDIYMKPPQGYTKAQPGQVCKLVKSLYGLKQASREWNHEFSRVLLAQGFTQSPHDHCLFIRGAGDQFVGILVFVDDVLLTGPNDTLIDELKSTLHACCFDA